MRYFMLQRTNSSCTIDYFYRYLPLPRIFEWNLFHHPILEQTCVDIDGVLCNDPEESENDDGPKYEQFLRTVKPIYIPTKEIGWLVTCRLEKYRELTAEWLERNSVCLSSFDNDELSG